MSAQCSTGCGRPSPDAFLCQPCADALVQVLAELQHDIADLQRAAARQTSSPLGLGDPARQWDEPAHDGALPVTPWPYAPGAADLLWVVANTLSTTVRDLCETRGVQPPSAPRGYWIARSRLYIRGNRMHVRAPGRVFVPLPEQPIAALCVWLIEHIESIRQDEGAGDTFDQIMSLPSSINAEVLGPPLHSEFFGLCDAPDVRVEQAGPVLSPRVAKCGTQLWGPEDAQRIDCPTCGVSYTRSERHEAMLRDMADHLGTVRQVASTLTALGRPVTIKQIDNWIRHGSVLTRGKALDETGRLVRTVRVGDVLEQRARVIERAKRGKSKRERMCA